MKLSCSLGMIALVSGALACSSDSGTPRNTTTPGAGGTAGQTGTAGSAGTSAAGTGGGAGSAGSSSGTAGTSGGSTTANLGPALTINDDGTVVDTAGNTGINGAALLVTSQANIDQAATFGVTFTPKAGALCVNGTTVPLPAVPAQSDYTNDWGFEVQIDLNRVANPSASSGDAGAADAGADAGPVLGQVAGPWDPKAHNVVGFAFKLTGQAADGGGVPTGMRLQSLPTGGDPSTDTYCNNLSPVSGATEQVSFSTINYQCYNTPPGRALFDQPLPAGFSGALQNLQWQINSQMVIPVTANFCISDIQPILGD